MCLLWPRGSVGVRVLSDNQGLSVIMFLTVTSLPRNIFIPVQNKHYEVFPTNKITTELYRFIVELFSMSLSGVSGFSWHCNVSPHLCLFICACWIDCVFLDSSLSPLPGLQVWISCKIISCSYWWNGIFYAVLLIQKLCKKKIEDSLTGQGIV